MFAESPTRVLAQALEWDALFVLDDRGRVAEVRTRTQRVESRFRPTR